MILRGTLVILVAGLAVAVSQQQQAQSNCWDFMGSIPRIRQFVARVASAAPSVQRKLALSEFKFTVFAYTNEAYVDAIAKGTTEETLSQSDTVKYHIYGGGLDSSNRIELNDFYWRDIDQTLLSVPVYASQMIESDPSEQFETLYYYINGARVIESWTNSTSCYVYGLDRVLLPVAKPQTIYGFLQATENNLSKLNDLVDVVAANEPSILTSLKQLRLGTAFLPTDDVFDKLEPGTFDRIKSNPAEAKKTLLAHFSFSAAYFTGKMKPGTLYPMEYSVIQGIQQQNSETGVVSYNGVRVKLAQADITLSNGVVHLIDSVLMPPNDDLVSALGKLENLSKFSSLVANDFPTTEFLKSSTRYTVFAPIDAAVGDVSQLRANETALASLLKGLIVRGQFATSNLKQLASVDEMVLPFASFLTTVSGSRLNIVKIHNDLFISDGSSMARLLRGYTDIAASNGIIHYVDALIGRPSRSIFDTIGSFGTNLNSTAHSLRQLGFGDELGTSLTSMKTATGQEDRWWVMFVPIESSWPLLRQKKGAAALLRNRLAMMRVWQRHIFFDERHNTDEADEGFIRQSNLSSVNQLLSARHHAETVDSADVTISETSRNNFQLNFGQNSYKILFSNIGCSNGVIHIIDRLILTNDEPIAELNMGNPRIIGAQVTVAPGPRAVTENVTHLTVTFDDYGSTVDAFASAGPIDLTRAENASVRFTVDTGDFHNISSPTSNNITAPLPAFSFSVPEWDLQSPNAFSRSSTAFSSADNARKKFYQYNFSKRHLAEAGLCNISANPVALALPGHHQGRASLNFNFLFGPVILSIKANATSRGCLFTCNVATCPENRPMRVLWAFSTDQPSDESNDEAFSLGNVASNSHQFYLDAGSCGRMIASVSSDATARRSLTVSCRATLTNEQGNDENTQTAVANFYDLVANK